MEIVLEKGGTATERIARLVDTGDLHLIGGDICEPIVCCSSQETAMVELLGRTARSGRPHKLVLSADPADLGDIG